MCSDNREVETSSVSESPLCSDCVPLRVPPVKIEALQLETMTVSARRHAAPAVPFVGPERYRLARPEQGHRLALALLSSVVLLT
jgi:hypothetical protein